MKRIGFALKQAWLARSLLKGFLTDSAKQVHNLEQITVERLEKANIAMLILDFDGVLAPHDGIRPLPEAHDWLRKLSQDIGEYRIVLLTNKPTSERLRYFSQHFPSIHVVQGVRKKPYPDGIIEVINYKGVAAHRVVLVDDRLLTGMLATCLSYCQGWYFNPPMTNYKRHPFKEMFFGLLRVSERGLIRLLG